MPHSRRLRERVAGQTAMLAVVGAERRHRGRLARFFGVNPLISAVRPAYRDALGDLIVGDILTTLGQRWDVLHDLPLGEGILDHLVIGPPGVFAVSSINRPVDDLVAAPPGDLREADIERAIAQARRVSAILSDGLGRPVSVHPLVAIVRRGRMPVSSHNAPVIVVSSSELARMLTRAPQLLSGDEVARLSDVADLVTTWPLADAAALDTQQLHRDFGTVRQDVRAASHRRTGWWIAALVAAYILTLIIVSQLVLTIMRTA